MKNNKSEIEEESYFDGDYRKTPKTNLFCAYCQRDLDIKKIRFFAFLSFKDTPTIFNPLFINNFKNRNIQILPIGNECAKHFGKDWLIKVNSGLLKAKDDFIKMINELKNKINNEEIENYVYCEKGDENAEYNEDEKDWIIKSIDIKDLFKILEELSQKISKEIK